MKYVFIDDCETELFNQEFDEKEDAINEAQATWNHLSESDKKRRKAFCIIESVNPDEESENHLDGETIRIWK